MPFATGTKARLTDRVVDIIKAAPIDESADFDQLIAAIEVINRPNSNPVVNAKYQHVIADLKDLIDECDDRYAQYMLNSQEEDIEKTTRAKPILVKSFTPTDDKADLKQQIAELKREYIKLIKEAITDYVNYLKRLTPVEREKIISDKKLKQQEKEKSQKVTQNAERDAREKVARGERAAVSVSTRRYSSEDAQNDEKLERLEEWRRMTEMERLEITDACRSVVLDPHYYDLINRGELEFSVVRDINQDQAINLLSPKIKSLIFDDNKLTLAEAKAFTPAERELLEDETYHELFLDGQFNLADIKGITSTQVQMLFKVEYWYLFKKGKLTVKEALALSPEEKSIIEVNFYNIQLINGDITFKDDIKGITAEKAQALLHPQIKLLIDKFLLTTKDALALTKVEKDLLIDPVYHQLLLAKKIYFENIKGVTAEQHKFLMSPGIADLIANEVLLILNVKELTAAEKNIITDPFFQQLLLRKKVNFEEELRGIQLHQSQILLKCKGLINNNRLTAGEVLHLSDAARALINDPFYHRLLFSGKCKFEDIRDITDEQCHQLLEPKFKQLIKAKAFTVKEVITLDLTNVAIDKLLIISPMIGVLVKGGKLTINRAVDLSEAQISLLTDATYNKLFLEGGFKYTDIKGLTQNECEYLLDPGKLAVKAHIVAGVETVGGALKKIRLQIDAGIAAIEVQRKADAQGLTIERYRAIEKYAEKERLTFDTAQHVMKLNEEVAAAKQAGMSVKQYRAKTEAEAAVGKPVSYKGPLAKGSVASATTAPAAAVKGSSVTTATTKTTDATKKEGVHKHLISRSFRI